MDAHLVETLFLLLASGFIAFMWWQYRTLLTDVKSISGRIVKVEAQIEAVRQMASSAMSEANARAIVREEMADMKGDIKSLSSGMTEAINNIDARLNQLMMHMINDRKGGD